MDSTGSTDKTNKTGCTDSICSADGKISMDNICSADGTSLTDDICSADGTSFMDNTSCNDALQQNSKLLTTLLEVSNLVTSTMELRPLARLSGQTQDHYRVQGRKIFIASGDRVRVIAHRSKLRPEQERTYSLPLEKEILKNPVVIDDLWSDEGLAAEFRKNMLEYMDTIFRDARCWMSLPMVYKDTVIGFMTLDHTEPGHYSDYHVELGTAFANQAALEYENAKLYDEVNRRLQKMNRGVRPRSEGYNEGTELNRSLRIYWLHHQAGGQAAPQDRRRCSGLTVKGFSIWSQPMGCLTEDLDDDEGSGARCCKCFAEKANSQD